MRLTCSLLTLSIALAACGGENSSNTVVPTVINAAPSVDAGLSQEADERTIVQLSANVTDTDGDGQLSWMQLSGPAVNLTSETITDPSFRAPDVSTDTDVTLRVTIHDGVNPAASDNITILIKNRTPSPQGINDNTNDRRDRARNRRGSNRPQDDNLEVRTYDGTNNNVANPLYGATFTQLVRLGDADYGDLVSSLSGASRPSARLVSNAIVAQSEGVSIPNSVGASDFVWQWGQFIDHDIGITDGAEEAADIAVPTGDIFFDPKGTGLEIISFNRAFYDPSTGTTASDPRQQENEITAWIDGSNVYGSGDDRALALRVSADSPFLATSNGNLLPFNTSGQANANALGVADENLFLAGDVRANEQVGLATLHTLFMREHNRLAQIFQNDDPGATGEEVFQRARRMVIAKLQKITYNEYLPALIGPNAISPYTGYKPSVNPGLYNEFSVAAYRYGHSLVNENILRVDANGDEISDGHLELTAAFFTAPSILESQDSIDPILRGLAAQPHQKLDTRVITDLRNMLFGPPGSGGLDLASLNIQRGRDHGVQSYNDMREVMGLPRKLTFSEITSDSALQTALSETYANVDDIDLWVGGLAEDPLTSENSQLGELFRDMHILQFKAFRDGDRFWYENDLTPDELARIANVTLAQVIRDNTNIGNELQDNVFLIP